MCNRESVHGWKVVPPMWYQIKCSHIVSKIGFILKKAKKQRKAYSI